MNIDQALEHYLTQLRANGRSKHTIDQARRHVALFESWLAASGRGGAIADLHHEDVARFCASATMTRRADGAPRKATSANALRSSLKCFFGYCHDAGFSTTHAGRLIRRERCGKANRPGLQDSEQLLSALSQAEGPLERRDKVMFTLMLRTGLRVGTTIALDIEDVNLDARTLTLRRMKGGEQDIAFIPSDLTPTLREYIGEHRRGPLWLGAHGGRVSTRQVARRLAMWLERAGSERRFGPHQLRHHFGTQLLRATGNLAIVQRAMHHKSIASTMAYVRVADDQLRTAIEG